MNRIIIVISVVVIVAIGGYLLYPIFKGKWRPVVRMNVLDASYQHWLSENDLTDPIEDVNIVITKDNTKIYLMSGDELLERWDVALSINPEGQKENARDGKTPVGEYTIVSHERRTDYHLMLFINYPNVEDANEALNEEKITELEHREIMAASNKGLPAPEDTPLGGGLGIHGGGTSRNWTTDGSFAVDDGVIEILWGACPNGTPVTIYENYTDWELADMMMSS